MLTSGVCISQLPADHSSISAVPEVITYCPPLVIDAHLHSTLILIGASHQTNITIGTVATGSDCRELQLQIQFSCSSTNTTTGRSSYLGISLQHPLSGHGNSRQLSYVGSL